MKYDQLLFQKSLYALTAFSLLVMVTPFCLVVDAKSNTAPVKKIPELKMTIGKGVSVCDAYKKYLDSVIAKPETHPNEIIENLMCTRPIAQTNKEFSQPTWREADPRDFLELATDIEESIWGYLAYKNPPEAVLKDKYKVEQRINTQHDIVSAIEYPHKRWYVAEADIENEGAFENLIKYRRGRCNSDWPDVNHFQIPIFVTDKSMRNLNVSKSRQILGNKPFERFDRENESFDIFSYAGKTYVDRWQHYGTVIKTQDTKTLSVFLHQGNQASLVCEFKIRPQ